MVFFQHPLFQDESFQELFQFAVSTSTLSGNAMLQEPIKSKSLQRLKFRRF